MTGRISSATRPLAGGLAGHPARQAGGVVVRGRPTPTATPTRILILSLNFPPDLIGAARYGGELAAWLVERGFEVEVVTAPPYYPAWRLDPQDSGWRYRRETIAGAAVTRCPLWVRPHLSGRGRLLHLASFAATSAPVLLQRALVWRPHVVFAVCPTLFALPAALLAARLAGARTWLHVQDLEIDAAFALGLLGNPRLRRLALGAEKALLAACDMVSSLTPGMVGRLTEKGVPAQRTHLLPNWVDPDDIRCLPERGLSEPGGLRAELGYDANDVVTLYAGNMGNKQGLDTVIEAARLTAHLPHLRYLLVGDGSERTALEAAARGLGTVRFLPLVPAGQLNDLMNAADIHVLPQRADADGLMMPSKLSVMMTSGRPVVAGAAAGSEVARVLAGCGVVVPPGSGPAFADAVRSLAGAPDRCRTLGREARRRALALWNRHDVLTGFEHRLQSLAGGTRHAAGNSRAEQLS